MVDIDDRPVAGLLGDGSGWETSDRCCVTEVEHTWMGWAIAARSGATRRVLARASPRWRPAAYALRLEAGGSYGLARVPLTGRWVLRSGRDRLAQIDAGPEFLSARLPVAAERTPVATVQLESRARRVPERPDLLVLLALQVIRADASVPAVDAGVGGP